MDKLQAPLDEQDAERRTGRQHARRMFNLSARTTITVQQLEAARKAINSQGMSKSPKDSHKRNQQRIAFDT